MEFRVSRIYAGNRQGRRWPRRTSTPRRRTARLRCPLSTSPSPTQAGSPATTMRSTSLASGWSGDFIEKDNNLQSAFCVLQGWSCSFLGPSYTGKNKTFVGCTLYRGVCIGNFHPPPPRSVGNFSLLLGRGWGGV
jgi:hypothetical protein